jgi:hypothetical protein
MHGFATHGFATFCLLLTATLPAAASAGSLDPVFSGLPLEQWLHDSPRARINWTSTSAEVRLSTQQRLFSRVEFRLDGRELDRRRNTGRLLLLLQLTDERGVLWQSHYSLNLDNVAGDAKANDYQFLQPFFIRPGNYTVTLAVYDAGSGNHGAIRRKLHVAGLRNDPLPAAWRDLPAVEFIGPGEPPDIWFMPDLQGRLHLSAAAKRPAEVDVFVNFTPSERLAGSVRMRNQMLSTLLPAVKVLSQVDWGNDNLNLELLDLARTQILFDERGLTPAAWSKALAAIKVTQPGLIDVKSLGNRTHSAEFFSNEIGQRATQPLAAGHARAIIVLTASVNFKPGVDLKPFEGNSPPGQKIFYLRFQPPRPIIYSRTPSDTPGRSIGIDAAGSIRRPQTVDEVPAPARLGPEIDQLAPLLRALNPELFNFTTPSDFRKALARILSEVSAM